MVGGGKHDEDADLLVDASDLLECLVGYPLPARIDSSLLADPGIIR